jgi:hypothetical protein
MYWRPQDILATSGNIIGIRDSVTRTSQIQRLEATVPISSTQTRRLNVTIGIVHRAIQKYCAVEEPRIPPRILRLHLATIETREVQHPGTGIGNNMDTITQTSYCHSRCPPSVRSIPIYPSIVY